MNIAVYHRIDLTSEQWDFVQETMQRIKNQGHKVDTEVHADLNFDNPPPRPDLVIVFGGDGTLLRTVQKILSWTIYNFIPVLAVNMGHLGFLTSANIDLKARESFDSLITEVLEGNYETQDRSLMGMSYNGRPGECLVCLALNDVVVKNPNPAHAMTFELLCDGESIAEYRADGIIVATPTGSTAYSLAAGGPIVHPKLDAMIVTPICPHTLTYRPLVVPGQSVIRVKCCDGSVAVDGRTLDRRINVDVQCRMIQNRLRLIQPRQQTYFNILRTKLNWGI